MKKFFKIFLFLFSNIVFADITNISMNGESLLPNFKPSTINYSLPSISIVKQNKLCVIGNKFSIKYAGNSYKPDDKGCTTLDIKKINKASSITVSDNEHNYTLNLLPKNFPELITIGHISQKYLLFTLNNKFDYSFTQHYLVIIDANNNIVYYHYFLDHGWVSDFKIIEYNNQKYYSYIANYIDDKNSNIIKSGDINHDLLENGNAILLSNEFDSKKLPTTQNTRTDLHEIQYNKDKYLSFYAPLQIIKIPNISIFNSVALHFKAGFYAGTHVLGNLYHKFFPDQQKMEVH